MNRKTPDAPLSEFLRQVLVGGPQAAGVDAYAIPTHDALREIWAIHGPALKAAYPRKRLWFEERDYFVRALHGEV